MPAALDPDRELIQVMAFGVVLFTLLVQSTTMGTLIRRLGIVMPDPLQTEYELRQARLLSFRSAAAHLDRMHHDGLISEHVWETLRPTLQARVETMAQAVRDLQLANPTLSDEEFERARRELLRAQRGALLGLRRDGVISEEAFERLVTEVDIALMRDATSESEEMAIEAADVGDVTSVI